jgi:hypothetical protein
MTKISSGSTAFRKKVLPFLWFGIIGISVVVSLWAGVYRGHALLVLPPLLAAVLGVVLMKKLVWDLVDEVYDCGDFLLVRNGGVEDRVALSNIMNINASTMTNPPRVTLRLSVRGKFGNEIVFSPLKPITLNLFARNQVVDDLIVRVDAARRAAHAVK